MRTHDVVIVGGGPSGAMAGALIAQRGMRVTILESCHFPRFHVGESLIPASMPLFRQTGLLERLDATSVRKPGVLFFGRGLKTESIINFRETFSDGYAFQVTRSVFDSLLLEHARQQGAELRSGATATEAILEGGRVRGVSYRLANGAEEKIHADLVLDASGRRSFLGRRFGLLRSTPGLEQSAHFAHFRDAAPDDGDFAGYLRVYYFARHGWIWWIPLPGGLTSVGVVSSVARVKERKASPEEYFLSCLAANDQVAERLAGAQRVSPVHTVSNYSFRLERLHGPGFLLLGDAAGFIDPVFSSGVFLALRSAQLAAEAAAASLGSTAFGQHAAEAYEAGIQTALTAFADLVQLFYELDVFFLYFLNDRRYRKRLLNLAAGEVYDEENRSVLEVMRRFKRGERVALEPIPGLLRKKASLR